MARRLIYLILLRHNLIREDADWLWVQLNVLAKTPDSQSGIPGHQSLANQDIVHFLFSPKEPITVFLRKMWVISLSAKNMNNDDRER